MIRIVDRLQRLENNCGIDTDSPIRACVEPVAAGDRVDITVECEAHESTVGCNNRASRIAARNVRRCDEVERCVGIEMLAAWQTSIMGKSSIPANSKPAKFTCGASMPLRPMVSLSRASCGRLQWRPLPRQSDSSNAMTFALPG